jgi:hypothetical protein
MCELIALEGLRVFNHALTTLEARIALFTLQNFISYHVSDPTLPVPEILLAGFLVSFAFQ